MRNADAATSFWLLLFSSLATRRAVIIQPASTYGLAQACTSGEKAYWLSLSQLTRSLAESAFSTVARNPATSFCSTTVTAGLVSFSLPEGLLSEQPTLHPPPLGGTFLVITSGLVRSYRNG